MSENTTAARVVVIGSGFGGMASAVRLAGRGHPVTVVESLDAPGGRAYVHRMDGYTFDAGPTIITAPSTLEELWATCGAKFADDIQLRPIDPFYEVHFDDGTVFAYSADLARVREQVARLNPADVAGFDRFLAASQRIYDVAYTELADKPFGDLWSLLRAAPGLVRLGGWRSVYAMVSSYFEHPKLRMLFSFHPLLVGGNPLSTTAYYCLIAHLERTYGVHYAMGGTGALIRGMVKLLESKGGVLRCKSEVRRITTHEGRATGVELASGEHIAADVVVSNAEVAWTYSKLLADHPRKRWTDAKLARSAYSMSLFVWYFGTDKRYEDVYHHVMLFSDRYKGLLGDIFDRKVLAEDFSLYLHRPTASDPSLAPPGCDAFYVLSPVPNLKGGADWAKVAETYRQSIQRHLEATVLPDLGRHIVTSRVTTPVDFRDRLLSVHGAAFGLEPRLLQSAWFRPHNRSEELRGLYLAGAGTHPGAGIPGVLCSAKIVDDLVAEDFPIR
jgi:phytoene desaturase